MKYPAAAPIAAPPTVPPAIYSTGLDLLNSLIDISAGVQTIV